MCGVSNNTGVRARSKPENIIERFCLPSLSGVLCGKFYLSTKLGMLCRVILPIHLLWDLRRKLSVYIIVGLLLIWMRASL